MGRRPADHEEPHGTGSLGGQWESQEYSHHNVKLVFSSLDTFKSLSEWKSKVSGYLDSFTDDEKYFTLKATDVPPIKWQHPTPRLKVNTVQGQSVLLLLLIWDRPLQGDSSHRCCCPETTCCLERTCGKIRTFNVGQSWQEVCVEMTWPPVEGRTQVNSVGTLRKDPHEDLVPIDHVAVLQLHREASGTRDGNSPSEVKMWTWTLKDLLVSSPGRNQARASASWLTHQTRTEKPSSIFSQLNWCSIEMESKINNDGWRKRNWIRLFDATL